MKPERAGDYVGHMVEAIDRIATYLEGLDRMAFLADLMVQDAVIRNFEVNGEAARNVERHAPNVVAAHPEIPWRYAKRMRNHLMHGYSVSTWKACGLPPRPISRTCARSSRPCGRNSQAGAAPEPARCARFDVRRLVGYAGQIIDDCSRQNVVGHAKTSRQTIDDSTISSDDRKLLRSRSSCREASPSCRRLSSRAR
jgi:uncharacterized protein with HEPN domain